MAFENWSQSTRDVSRIKRLVISSSVGAVGVVGSLTYLVLTSQAAAQVMEEEAKIVEVQLEKEPEPPAEPEAPPPPPEPQPKKQNPGPRLETPTTISDEKLQEKDAKPADDTDPFEQAPGDGSTDAQKAVVEPVVAPPPPPPPPKIEKPKPRPVGENDTPPELIGEAVVPEMPAEAKLAGIEGTVVVKYVVTETGAVSDVRVLKGPPELHAVCIAAVKAMRFKPGRDPDGVPRAFTKIKSFRFKLRT